MSDSSSSGSYMRASTRRKASPAKSVGSRRSTASKRSTSKKTASPTKKKLRLKPGLTIGTTKVGPGIRAFPPLTNSYRKAAARATRRYRREHSGSNNDLTMTEIKKREAAQKAKMFRRLGRKVGHELGVKEKKIVLNEINAASVSGSPNINEVVHKLKLLPVKNAIKEFAKKQREILKHNASLRKAHKKEFGKFEGLAGKDFNAVEKAVLKNEGERGTAADREEGKREYESRKARVLKERADLEKRIKAAKKVVKDDFARFYKSTGSDRTPSESEVLAVATLAAHGFDVMPGEHRYLKKHLIDEITDSIRRRLIGQLMEDGVEACDACVMEEYLKSV